jgi:hypothetical protein
MANQDFLKAACTSCGGKVEFPATALGMTVECPHCHAQTELQPMPGAGRNVWRLFLFAILGLGIAVGILLFLKSRKAEPVSAPPQSPPAQTNLAAPSAAPSRPKSLEDLKVLGPVSIDKAKNSRLSYAIGTLKNDSEHQRFGLKIELELFDATGNKLANRANDYVQMLEPQKNWNFRALVLEPKAVTAKVVSIQED